MGENHEFLDESDVKESSYFPITLDFCRLLPQGSSNFHKVFYMLHPTRGSYFNMLQLVLYQATTWKETAISQSQYKVKCYGYLILISTLKSITHLLCYSSILFLFCYCSWTLSYKLFKPKSPFPIQQCIFYEHSLLVVCILCRNMKWGIISWYSKIVHNESLHF